MVYGYIRVSTDRQDTDNQKTGIIEFAKRRGIDIEKWISDDGVSGTVDYKDRKLGGLIKKLKKGDVVIASEISRFARSIFMIFEILKHFSESQIEMYTVKDGYSLDGTISSKILAFAFGMASEIERDLISKRTKEALDNRRRAGVVLGRPLGGRSDKRKLAKKHEDILMYLKNGLTYAAIGRLTKTDRGTVREYCIYKGLEQYKCMNIVPYAQYENMQNEEVLIQLEISNEDILKLYTEGGYSFFRVKKEMELGGYDNLRRFLKQRGLLDYMIEINKKQRKECKSYRQIEIETGVPARIQQKRKSNL